MSILHAISKTIYIFTASIATVMSKFAKIMSRCLYLYATALQSSNLFGCMRVPCPLHACYSTLLTGQMSHASHAMQGREGLWDAGSVRVQTLDWNSPSDVQAAGGPFHYVLAADCVYNEMHVEPLYNVVLALTDAKSTGLPHLLFQKSRDLSDSMYLSCAQPQSLHNWTDQC